jgi:C4-dicarboxylate-binding protein DctP
MKFNTLPLFTLLVLISCSAQASPIIIKLSHVVAQQTPKGQAAEYFKKLAEERTKGAVKVEVYPNSQLYKDREEMEALQLGAVQMLVPSLAKFSPLGLKEFELFDLPFIFDNYSELHEVTQGPVGAKLLNKLERKGIVGLAFWDNGFKVMSANKPLKAPDDFKGQKMRIQSSRTLDSQMRSVGAIPQVMAFSEVYQALQTGVVDGTENPPSNLYTQKMHEVQKYITLSNHGYLGYAVIVNKKFWAGLPADIRTVLEGAMKDATTYANDLARRDNEEALAAVKRSGRSELIALTPQERAAWKKSMEKAHKDNVARIGADTVREVYAATDRTILKEEFTQRAMTENLPDISTTINKVVVPPDLSASVVFSEPFGNNMLNAGGTGKLAVTVKNSGKGDAHDVRADINVIKNNKKIVGLDFDRVANFGTVPVGSQKVKDVYLRASEELMEGNLTFSIEMKEANGFDPQPIQISLQTKVFEPPKLIMADLGIADQNSNGKIEPMEITEVTARIQNVGHGDARDVLAEVQAGQNVFMASETQTLFKLGNIPSGQYHDVKFMFYTNNRIKNGERIPIKLQITEARPRFSITQQLALTMNAPQKSAQEFVAQAIAQERKSDIQIASGLSVDVDQNIPEGQKAGKDDIAVVIGNKNYSAGGAPDVDFAVRDAAIMKEYLIHTMGFDQGNIMYAEDATLSKFTGIFGGEGNHKGQLYKWVKAGISRVFVYYSGHGAPDLENGEAYFIPVDANPQLIKVQGFRVQTFYDNLEKLKAKSLTVVLDACFSGASPKGNLFKGTSALVRVDKQVTKPASALLIASSSGDQVSSWYADKRHGLFTYYFLKGLQGEADADRNGSITAGEIRTFLNEHVPYMARRLTGNEQTPLVSGRDSEVLAILKPLRNL